MKRKLLLSLIILITISISIVGCDNQLNNQEVTSNQQNNNDNTVENKIIVAVSIVPQETFVKAVAGNLVSVVTMIPPGNSPANYQPTPNELVRFSDASIYFSIGVPTEEANILPKAKDLNKNIRIIALADKVGEVYPHRYFGEDGVHEHDENHVYEENNLDNDDNEDNHGHEHGAKDPHIWLSPKRVKVMINVIKEELVKLDPDNKDIYEKNAQEYIHELDLVDQEIREILNGVEQQAFIIYHPSFGYFADDYELKMVTIEESGKEATAKKLQQVIDFAKDNNIRFVFYQAEFDSQQAKTIAHEINGEAIQINSLSPEYIKSMKEIANKFRSVLQ